MRNAEEMARRIPLIVMDSLSRPENHPTRAAAVNGTFTQMALAKMIEVFSGCMDGTTRPGSSRFHSRHTGRVPTDRNHRSPQRKAEPCLETLSSEQAGMLEVCKEGSTPPLAKPEGNLIFSGLSGLSTTYLYDQIQNRNARKLVLACLLVLVALGDTNAR